MMHESADPELLNRFAEGLAKPDKDELRFDMTEGPDSQWNNVVIRILTRRLQEAAGDRLPSRPREYYLDLVREKFKRARNAWKRAQPKVSLDGQNETPDDVAARVSEHKQRQWTFARERERRVNVCVEFTS
jgi:hypothetical protein